MNGLKVYLEQTEGYEKVMDSSVLYRSFEEELGYVVPVYTLYRHAE
ncbi:MAG: hypothetical protein IJ600_09655 [Lachnospiraceae bacterium]|nr:hypothetical protein [Lachnospiraceae bacterium]